MEEKPDQLTGAAMELLRLLHEELRNPKSKLNPELVSANLEAILQRRSALVGLAEVDFGGYRTAPMPAELWLRNAFVTTAQLGLTHATQRHLEGRNVRHLGSVLLYSERELRYLGSSDLEDLKACLAAVGVWLPHPRDVERAKSEDFWVELADHRSQHGNTARIARCQLPLMTMTDVAMFSGVDSARLIRARVNYFGEILSGTRDDLTVKVARTFIQAPVHSAASAKEWAESRKLAEPIVSKFVAWMKASGLRFGR